MAPRKLPAVDERRVPAGDGTDLAAHVLGSGPDVLLCGGLGGSWIVWTHQLAYLGDRYRFIGWDYRGLYRSGPPPRSEDVTVAHQVDDAVRVLDAQGVERTAVLAWSLGTQVALELFRRHPERIAALVLVNGVAGPAPVARAPLVGKVAPTLLRGLADTPFLAESLTLRLAKQPELVRWAKRLGFAARTVDETLFEALAHSFSELDMEVFLRTLEQLGVHDARDVLPTIDVPTLVVAGARDRFTPREDAEAMADAIPGAERMIVPGGTHYVALEYPEVLSLRLEKFFRERGWGRGAAGSAP